MRRLPIYFLIDISESMVGEPIEQVENGINTIVSELRTDPYALETVWMSIIAFAGKPKKITPLIDLISFYQPRLPIGGGTSLGSALDFLMQEMDSSIVKTTLDAKGDWKPIVFLFTDGVPTDDYEKMVKKWESQYRNKAFMVAISFGSATDTALLSRLTDTVLKFKNTDAAAYKQFFKWVTASIKTTSMSVNENNVDGLQLASLDESVISKEEIIPGQTNSNNKMDTNFAVFLGRCQKTLKYYLMKYKSATAPSEIPGFNTKYYKLEGSYQIDQQYFDLRDSRLENVTINTGELGGFPPCPCCGNMYGFSTCSCGGLMCTGNEEVSKCPWCGAENRFGFSEGTANINRTRG